MKKIVWLAIPIALSLLSCSKDEPQNDGRLEVKLYAYMLDEAGRNAKKTSAHFYSSMLPTGSNSSRSGSISRPGRKKITVTRI